MFDWWAVTLIRSLNGVLNDCWVEWIRYPDSLVIRWLWVILFVRRGGLLFFIRALVLYIRAIEMRWYHKVLCISYKDHVTNEEVRAKIQQAIGPHGDLLTTVNRRKLKWYELVSVHSVWPKSSYKVQ